VTLRGPRVLLRPVRPDDVPVLAAIAAEPSVARWWRDVPEASLRAKAAGTDDVTAFAVEVEGAVVGMLEFHEEPEPDYRHAGIDLFLAAAAQGQGLGREAVSLAVEHLIGDLGHHRITIDPAADNERAIRCYTAVGFRTVGVMQAYERGPDGTFHDGLLMELVRVSPR
jgi:aminoglycoside 6'-N-acetyltransferase